MIDITKLTPDQIDRLLYLQSIIDRQTTEAAKVRASRDYYSGDHPVMLTARQQEYIGGALTKGDFPFSHNLVKAVVDTLRERLNVTGFTVNGEGAGEGSPAAQLAGLLWDWFKLNKLESQQIRLYRRALRDGKTYLMIDYDAENSRPRLTLHEVDDGQTGILLHRDPEDENRVLYASRYFYTFDPLTVGATGKERRTVYLPHEIRKYTRNRNALAGGMYSLWEKTQDAGDLGWPLAWSDPEGRALGVAAVEFANPGGSEVPAVAGLQNALNKAWLDLLAAADTAGFPVMVIENALAEAPPESEEDEDIEGADEFKIGPGRYIQLWGAQLKRIEGAELDDLINLVWTIVNAISGVTRTPHQYLRPFLSADVPSGEALKQLEAGLVAKAQERQLVFGEAWAEALTLAIRVAGTFGPSLPQVEEPLTIGVQWADAQTRQEKAEAEIAAILKGLGVPDDAVWERAGFTPEQIASFKEAALIRRSIELATVAAAVRNNGQAPAVNGAVTNGRAPGVGEVAA